MELVKENKSGLNKGVKKPGATKKYTNKDGIKVNIETVNRLDCKAITIDFGCYVTSEIPLQKLIDAFRRRIKCNGYSLTYSTFPSLRSHLWDISHTESKQYSREKSTTFIRFEFTLFDQWNWFDLGSHDKLRDYAYSMIETIKSVDEEFIFTTYRK